MERTRNCRNNFYWEASEVQFRSARTARASVVGHQEACSEMLGRGKLENPSMRGSHFMSMFNDIEWTKRGNFETRLHYAKEVAAHPTQIQAMTRVLLGACVRKYVVEMKFLRTSRTKGYCRIPDGFHLSATEEEIFMSHGTLDNKKIVINTMLTSNLLGICSRICWVYEIEKSGTHTKNSGRR